MGEGAAVLGTAVGVVVGLDEGAGDGANVGAAVGVVVGLGEGTGDGAYVKSLSYTRENAFR